MWTATNTLTTFPATARLLLGHSHPAIADAVAEQIRRGTHLGACTDEEVRWARAIMNLMPAIERVRFHSSGTEATLMAMRLARAYTGRNKVIKLQDHFHGWHDYAMAGSDRPGSRHPRRVLGQHGHRAGRRFERRGAGHGSAIPTSRPSSWNPPARTTASFPSTWRPTWRVCGRCATNMAWF